MIVFCFYLHITQRPNFLEMGLYVINVVLMSYQYDVWRDPMYCLQRHKLEEWEHNRVYLGHMSG